MKTLKAPKRTTENQQDYIVSISENIVTICMGPAGSGKTFLSAYMALDYLMSDRVKRIVLTRPTVEAGKGIGFLPGSAMEKVNPYMVPMIEEMKKVVGEEEYNKLVADKKIEIIPLDYCRGRNWHDSFVILDEAANATLSQMKMIITRIGKNSKLVINGDPEQTDLKHVDSGALIFTYKRLEGIENVGVVQLTEKDIMRNKIIAPIMARLKDEDFQNFQSGKSDNDQKE